MQSPGDLATYLDKLEARLGAMDHKLDALVQTRTKAMEWIGTLSEHVRSLDAFREEVRASLEPLFAKLEHIDEVMRILRHATSDVSRRMDEMEGRRRKAG